MIEKLELEKNKVLGDIDKRGSATAEERDFLNRLTRDNLQKVLKEFEKNAMNELDIKEGDTAEEIKFKVSFGDKIIKWLGDLFTWVMQKVKEIMAKVKEALKWCWQQVKDLFSWL